MLHYIRRLVQAIRVRISPRRALRKRGRGGLSVEFLEDRTLPAVNFSGFVGGTAFIDANGDGIRQKDETRLAGVMVHLSGDADAVTTTDINGQFSFRSLAAGDYKVRAGSVSSLLNPNPTTPIRFTLEDGEALRHQDLGFASGPARFPGDLSKPFRFLVGTPGKIANRAPRVSEELGTVSLPQNTKNHVIDLAGFFTDADYTQSQVRFNVTVTPDGSATPVQKTLTVDLFDANAPQAVTNFFDYINAGAYNNSIFHHLANNGFSGLQGGALTLNGAGTGFNAIATNPPIPGEFSEERPNVDGTIATVSNAVGTTSQFLFNTADNPSLDAQQFTVFGQLTDTTDLDSLAATPTKNVTNANLTHDFPAASFNKVPLNNYSGSAATFPGDATTANYLVINDVDTLRRDEFLTYKVVSNSNPDLVTASITNGFLTLNAVDGQTGTVKLLLRAKDRFGRHVDQVLTLNITGAPVVNSVSITPDNVANATVLTASPTSTPASGVTFGFQWFQNDFPIANATAQTLNLLTQVATVEPGDTFTVKVTPTQTVGNIVGATFTSSPVTVATASPDPITFVP